MVQRWGQAGGKGYLPSVNDYLAGCMVGFFFTSYVAKGMRLFFKSLIMSRKGVAWQVQPLIAVGLSPNSSWNASEKLFSDKYPTW